jgi:hypothetical protein
VYDNNNRTIEPTNASSNIYGSFLGDEWRSGDKSRSKRSDRDAQTSYSRINDPKLDLISHYKEMLNISAREK